MAGFTTKFEMKGVSKLLASLDLSKKGVRKAIRKGLGQAARLIRKSAVSKLRASAKDARAKGKPRNRLLEKSMSVKLSVKDKRAFAVVGPGRGFREQVGVRPWGEAVYEDPANIAHLVEYGHEGPHPAPPHPFLRPAYDENKDKALEIIKDAVAEGMVEGVRG